MSFSMWVFARLYEISCNGLRVELGCQTRSQVPWGEGKAKLTGEAKHSNGAWMECVCAWEISARLSRELEDG